MGTKLDKLRDDDLTQELTDPQISTIASENSTTYQWINWVTSFKPIYSFFMYKKFSPKLDQRDKARIAFLAHCSQYAFATADTLKLLPNETKVNIVYSTKDEVLTERKIQYASPSILKAHTNTTVKELNGSHMANLHNTKALNRLLFKE